jgi:hypothetical protein
MQLQVYQVSMVTRRKTVAVVTGAARDKAEAERAALEIVRHILKMQ